MSPTSYQLLYPAVFGTAKVCNFPDNAKLFFQESYHAVNVVFGEGTLLA